MYGPIIHLFTCIAVVYSTHKLTYDENMPLTLSLKIRTVEYSSADIMDGDSILLYLQSTRIKNRTPSPNPVKLHLINYRVEMNIVRMVVDETRGSLVRAWFL